jgi:hypothetical protein
MANHKGVRPSWLRSLKHVVTALLAAGFLVAGFAVMTGTSQAAGPHAAPLAAPPGDNADVKIHNAGTATDDQRDEPKVCSFYLDAFGFDPNESVTWDIVENTHGDTVLTGTITLDANGHGTTSDYTLPDGMYKLDWTFSGENGSAKHKVFKVQCASTTTTTTTTTVTTTTTPPTSSASGTIVPPVTTVTETETGTNLPTGVNAGEHTAPLSARSSAIAEDLAVGLGLGLVLWLGAFYVAPLLRRRARH